MRTMDVDIDRKLPIPDKMRIALQLKLTRLIEKYKSKYGDIKNGKM